MTIAEDVAKILLEINAVTLSPQKPYRFASGILSPIYCDNRIIISDVAKREKIVEYFMQTIKENGVDFDVVGGVATAGIPHAAWIADAMKKPMIYIRSSAKEHGKNNTIEGRLKSGQKVLIVEDLISTGGSIIDAVSAVRGAGGIVTHAIAIITYEMERAKNNFAQANCTPVTLSNFSTLVQVAGKLNYIPQEEIARILEWNKSPADWGKKMGFE
ncbi:MAG: orotate phosphoribosyltransferase [Nanoarchaeota archaeon]|nr:orotate phosphoribosyltransferase [Nanoarchaeota archaeon]MBU4452399.1 orotate phosphoribosyltransferase [Nanoarchaeota archaeon]MCG2723325.1 orotate phosphoribosyltransferase [archaeon]